RSFASLTLMSPLRNASSAISRFRNWRSEYAREPSFPFTPRREVPRVLPLSVMLVAMSSQTSVRQRRWPHSLIDTSPDIERDTPALRHGASPFPFFRGSEPRRGEVGHEGRQTGSVQRSSSPSQE